MRIVIAEDSALFREGLASLLTDAGHDIVARVPDAVTLLEAVREHRPDLAIVDIRMPPDRHRRRRAGGQRLDASTRTWGSCCSPSTSRPPTPSIS